MVDFKALLTHMRVSQDVVDNLILSDEIDEAVILQTINDIQTSKFIIKRLLHIIKSNNKTIIPR